MEEGQAATDMLCMDDYLSNGNTTRAVAVYEKWTLLSPQLVPGALVNQSAQQLRNIPLVDRSFGGDVKICCSASKSSIRASCIALVVDKWWWKGRSICSTDDVCPLPEFVLAGPWRKRILLVVETLLGFCGSCRFGAHHHLCCRDLGVVCSSTFSTFGVGLWQNLDINHIW